jgi:exoribonuclease-2
VRNGRTAALAAPFKPKDAQLFSIISGFDAAYAAYNGFQNGIERFWTIRYLVQNQITELTASVMKDGLVRADDLPLVFKAAGCDALPRGCNVRVRVTGTDEMTLDVHATLIERLDAAAVAVSEDESAEDEEEGAGPLTLTLDMDSPESAANESASAEATPT